MMCPTCGTKLPKNAQVCVTCWTTIAPRRPMTAAARPRATRSRARRRSRVLALIGGGLLLGGIGLAAWTRARPAPPPVPHGQPATSATATMTPYAVAISGIGRLLMSDQMHNTVLLSNLTQTPVTLYGQTVAPGQTTVVAGTGAPGYGGDGEIATRALLQSPGHIAVDRAGTLFVADTGNNRIRRVDAVTGRITTVAGTGGAGYSGDGAPATHAQLNGPVGVAVDAAGALFIADTDNVVVRTVDATTGVISTVAGNGTQDDDSGRGDGGPASQARLSMPVAVAVDGQGTLTIASVYRVRRVDAATGTISTIAGTGFLGYSGDGGPATQARLFGPSDVAVDRAGTVYLADGGNEVVRTVDSYGLISTVAGHKTGAPHGGYGGDGGPATAAALGDLYGVAVDTAGNLFIADTGNHRVREVHAGTGRISTVVGG